MAGYTNFRTNKSLILDKVQPPWSATGHWTKAGNYIPPEMAAKRDAALWGKNPYSLLGAAQNPTAYSDPKWAQYIPAYFTLQGGKSVPNTAAINSALQAFKNPDGTFKSGL